MKFRFAFARVAPLAVSLIASLFVARAQANTLSAIGGLGFGRNTGMNDIKTPAPLLGAEYMLDAGPVLEFGASYLENFLSYNSGESGSIRSIGADARAHFLGERAGPFADALIGVAFRTQGHDTAATKLSYGGGVGYEIPLGTRFSMSPHVGVRMLPNNVYDSATHPVVDGAFMFSLRL